jgi:hypothetical protein
MEIIHIKDKIHLVELSDLHNHEFDDTCSCGYSLNEINIDNEESYLIIHKSPHKVSNNVLNMFFKQCK